MLDLSPRDRLELQNAFERTLSTESGVHFDPYHRELYSTDASNHRLLPIGVVVPRDQDDLTHVVKLAAELNTPLLARGAGTSLAGQTVGRAVIVDCGKNLNKIIDLNPERQTAIVEPGVTCHQLNKAASQYGLMYGPDPASADRATFGGMIGNNATGAHSIRYGMTADHIERVWVTLADGSQALLQGYSSEEWQSKIKQRDFEGTIYRAAQRIRDDYRSAVEQDWPKTWRRASGYSLNYLVGYSPGRPPAWDPSRSYPDQLPTNLAPILAGSEGTLAVIRQAEVRLVPIPKAKALVLISNRSVLEAVRRVPELLEVKPAAIELIPRALIERAAAIPAYGRKLTFLDEIPEALLVVELTGDTPAQASQRAQELSDLGIVLDTKEAQANLWAVRKAGLGLLMSVPGAEKPITFIEDVAVPVDQLDEYVERVEAILAERKVKAVWYAHASAGCLHLRPMINLRTEQGVQLMRSVADEVAQVVLSLGGSMSGEHGDGLSHSEFNEQLFGPQLTQAFHELKRAFDPQEILNPGKIVASRRTVAPALDKNLRFDGAYRTQEVNTYFAHQREGGLAGAVEACVGLGVCRKEEGLMCPSFQATREETDLTRGRANALRAALAGQLPAGSVTSKQMHAIYDLCLECKGCKAECPTGVDVARVKAEFLSLYGQEHGFSLRDRLFANIRNLSKWGHRFGPVLGALADRPLVRWAQEKFLGIARERRLPPFKVETFSNWFQDHQPLTAVRGANQVALFLDSYTEYSYPEIGMAAIDVLEAAGFQVLLVGDQVCCGRPMISKGLLAQAKRRAELNLAAFSSYVEAGIPIIGLEPSCMSTLRDEYLEFFPDDPRAKSLAMGSYLIEEFFSGIEGRPSPLKSVSFTQREPEQVKLHTHCHSKALTGSAGLHQMLTDAGYQVDEIDSGCCGMAGSFGYETEHYQLSMKIGELRLLPAVRQASQQGIPVTAHGVSCRAQITDGTEAVVSHPIQLVARRLKK